MAAKKKGKKKSGKVPLAVLTSRLIRLNNLVHKRGGTGFKQR